MGVRGAVRVRVKVCVRVRVKACLSGLSVMSYKNICAT